MSNWILKFKPALEKIHSFKELFYLFVQHEIDTQFHSKYLDHGYYILNSNIYHHFSLLIGKNENLDGILDYIQFIYTFSKLKLLIDKKKQDENNFTPYELYQKESITMKWDCGMNLILNFPIYTIEKMQALIRGFLCRRRLLKMKYELCINEIIYAPKYFFGLSFEGGIEYQKFIEKYPN